ncbi:MAG: hypothetical protein ACOVQ6_00255 [Brevundimonas sp.]
MRMLGGFAQEIAPKSLSNETATLVSTRTFRVHQGVHEPSQSGDGDKAEQDRNKKEF